jgi:AAA ATPase domain
MLVGRRLAIGALGSAVDAAAGGAGGVVLLAGEAGMGKTALASEAVAYAKTRGAEAVWGTCWEGDGAPGFWPWIQVVRALAPEGGDAGEAVLAELTGVTEERGGGVLGDESAIRFRTYDMAAAYLRRRAGTGHWWSSSTTCTGRTCRRCGCSCFSPASCMTPPHWSSGRTATWR